jgi:aminoglycoside phosphotransferase (APT) family kinase protein
MQETQFARAVAAALSTASSLGLPADDAVVLHNSNKLSLRLLPGDVMARVAPVAQQNAQFEIDVVGLLTAAGSPVAALDPRVEPRVHERDGFAITLWTYYPTAPRPLPPDEYAGALKRLHTGMRGLNLPAPHFTDRVESAQRLVASRDETLAYPDEDWELLGTTLRGLRRAVLDRGRPEQLLHGEPHPGNLLGTASGPRFIDFETCCRGPVEFDLAHAPEEVADHYPGADPELLRDCRILMLAMVTAWRFDPDDQLPNGRALAAEWLAQIRAALDSEPGRSQTW